MSVYDKLLSFLEYGIISSTCSELGFDNSCYVYTNSEIPSETKYESLKEKLKLMITLTFCKENFTNNLKDYIENPNLYRKTLGKEFEWVRVFTDVVNFTKNKDEFILQEFDPIQ